MAKSTILVRSKLKQARAWVAENRLNEAKSLLIALYLKNKIAHDVGLELAVVHRKLGEFKEAESICKNIIKIAPKHAAAHHVLGSALQCLNQFDAAIDEYKLAIKRDKNLTEAHYFLGNIYQLTGSFELAAESFYKAVDLNPDFFEALNNLAAVLVELNRPIDAGNIIDRALRLDPDSPRLLCNVAGLSILENDIEKALMYANRVYNIDSGFVDALKLLGKIHYQQADYDEALEFYKKAYAISQDKELTAYIAQILERRGEFDEASKLITPLIEAGNTDVVTLLTYSALSRKFDTQRLAIDAVEMKINNSQLDTTSLINLHSELGKQYDSLKEYDSAFGHYEKANLFERELNKQLEVLNETRSLNNTSEGDIESWFKDYPAEFWRNLPCSDNDSERPVFVIGMFRSGTTLCEQILSSHPDVQGAGELRDINQLSCSIGNARLHDRSPASLASITQAKLTGAARSYLKTLDSHSSRARRVVDKMPANFLHVGLISRLFPKAHIVHMIRDPRDACLSMYFQRFGPQMTFSTDLIELADYHLAYQRVMQYWNDVLDIDIHHVVYEELMDDQENITRKMLAFCGLQWNEQCLRFHESKRDVNTPSYDQVRKPLYKKSVARWKHYEKNLAPLIDRLGLNAGV